MRGMRVRFYDVIYEQVVSNQLVIKVKMRSDGTAIFANNFSSFMNVSTPTLIHQLINFRHILFKFNWLICFVYFLFISMISSINFIRQTQQIACLRNEWIFICYSRHFRVTWIRPILMLSFCHLSSTFVCDMFVLLMGKLRNAIEPKLKLILP